MAKVVRGWIYALRLELPDSSVSPIKIGFTTDPVKRVRMLSAGAPFPVAHIGLWPAKHGLLNEQLLHEQFKAHRLNGEWFNPAPELLAVIETNTEEYRKRLGQSDLSLSKTQRLENQIVRRLLSTPEAYERYRPQMSSMLGYAEYCPRCCDLEDADFEELRTVCRKKTPTPTRRRA